MHATLPTHTTIASYVTGMSGSPPRTMQAPDGAETSSSRPSHTKASADPLAASAYAVLRRWANAGYAEALGMQCTMQ